MALVIYGTLISQLQASAYLAGTSVAFGEEMIAAQDQPLPYIVVVPKGGPIDGPGYVYGQDPNVENTWANHESIDVYCWAVAGSGTAVDNADACWTLEQQVLSAFQDQRNQQNTDGSSAPGLYWKPVSARWELMQDAMSRYGRARVISLVAEVSIPMAPPVEATITSETINASVSNAQHVA